MHEASLLQRFSKWQSNESEPSIVQPKSVFLFSSTVRTNSSLILDARHFPVIAKTLDFDSFIGSLYESAQWHLSFAEIFSESLSSGKVHNVLCTWRLMTFDKPGNTEMGR